MLASATAIWVIVIVVVLCLATWLTAVALAARRPYWKHATKRPMIGPVVGAIHYADGGRSVAPDREAPPVFTVEEDLEMRRAVRGQTGGIPRPRIPGQPVPSRAAADRVTPGHPADTPGPRMPAQREAAQDQPEHRG